MNARKLAAALATVRNTPKEDDGKNVVLIPSNVLIIASDESSHIDGPYTDNESVRLFYPDGTVYELVITKLELKRKIQPHE